MTPRPPHNPQLDDLLMAASLAEEARWRDARAAQPPVGVQCAAALEEAADPAATNVTDAGDHLLAAAPASD